LDELAWEKIEGTEILLLVLAKKVRGVSESLGEDCPG
jgi:hypothetical protein